LERNGSEHQPNPDDFIRQDTIGALICDGKVVALHAHSFFDLGLRATTHHSYFSRYFTRKAFRALMKRGSRCVMTMEQFSVDPGWRTPRLGVSMAAVMSGLAMKIAALRPVDTILAVARADIGVARIGWQQGGTSLDSGVMIHNTPCELLAFSPSSMTLPDGETVKELIEVFWNKRIDLTTTGAGGNTRPPAPQRKKGEYDAHGYERKAA
jgi:hypothetical protein